MAGARCSGRRRSSRRRARGASSRFPATGAPGPPRMDIGPVRVVMLDTEWWLHKSGPKPEGPADGCADSAVVFDSLRSLLAGTDAKATLVAGHHPLVSGGEHGGYFSWKDYFFPAASRGVVALAAPSGHRRRVSRGAQCGNFASGHVQPHYRAAHRFASVRHCATCRPRHTSPAMTTACRWSRCPPVLLQLVSGGGYYGHIDFISPIDGTLARARAVRLHAHRRDAGRPSPPCRHHGRPEWPFRPRWHHGGLPSR